MLFVTRLLWIGLLGVGIGVGIGSATPAQAGFQLFDASWTVKAFGNACAADDTNPGPYCGSGPASEFYSADGIPFGILCHPGQPRCPLESTPTDGKGVFSVLGGSTGQPLYCEPLSLYGGGTTTRPAKGATAKNPYGGPIPPLYRNPAFFRANGMPNTHSCGAQSTNGLNGGPGEAQIGHPLTGRWSAITTGTQRAGFNFSAAPTTPPPAGLVKGIRATGLKGEFGNTYPYLYSYTYGTLRNDQGDFGPGEGPGSFNLSFGPAGSRFARIKVKEGAAKFGGTMRLLGAMTTKVCYWLAAGGGGCSLGINNWRYEAIGVSAPTVGGVVTEGAMYTNYTRYYNTRQGSYSPITADGSRFPWTTGSVTVTAIRRGPHKTIHYAHGYDNRNTTTSPGLGTIQLVSPVLTTWLGYATYETGGIAVLRIKFLPEPQTWAILVAGASLLVVGTRMRGH